MFFLKYLKLPKKGTNIPGESKTRVRATSRFSNLKGAIRINVTQLDNGESAKVVELYNNNEIVSKLEARGIISGAIITKKSAILAKGPIIIEKDFVQFAIGYDMAQGIIVEPVNMDMGSNI